MSCVMQAAPPDLLQVEVGGLDGSEDILVGQHDTLSSPRDAGTVQHAQRGGKGGGCEVSVPLALEGPCWSFRCASMSSIPLQVLSTAS